MHYLEDPQRKMWPNVSRLIAALEAVDMVLWLYPGHGADDFVEPFLPAEKYEWLEPAIPREDDEPVYSRRVGVDETLLAMLEDSADDIEDWGEYLALYRPRDNNLVAAYIPHEGVILVADRLASALAADGLFLSDEPPGWW